MTTSKKVQQFCNSTRNVQLTRANHYEQEYLQIQNMHKCAPAYTDMHQFIGYFLHMSISQPLVPCCYRVTDWCRWMPTIYLKSTHSLNLKLFPSTTDWWKRHSSCRDRLHHSMGKTTVSNKQNDFQHSTTDCHLLTLYVRYIVKIRGTCVKEPVHMKQLASLMSPAVDYFFW